MFAPVQARSNAPNENVVGKPILAWSQSACVLKAVASMNSNGRSAESEKSPSPPTSGHGRRPRRAFLRAGPATATSALAISGAPPRQRADLDHPDHDHHHDQRHADRSAVTHVLVRERLVPYVVLGHVRVVA